MPTVAFFFSADTSMDKNLKVSGGPCNKLGIVPVTHHPPKGWHAGPQQDSPLHTAAPLILHQGCGCCRQSNEDSSATYPLLNLARYYLQEQFYDFLCFQLLNQGLTHNSAPSSNYSSGFKSYLC